MGVVQDALNPLDGYLVSLTRNTVDGWYELEVGLPTKWVYDENKEIRCEVIAEDKEYRLLKIIPKNQKVSVDDLIKFFDVIIETNEKIVKKEEEFKKKMERIKLELEGEAKKFYEELDSLKENSFKNVNENFVKRMRESQQTATSKKRRGRPPKNTEIKKEEVEKRKAPVVITNSDDDE